MNYKNLELLRFTFHKIYGKSATNAIPYADKCKEFCLLDDDGTSTLHKRILSTLDHKSKFFELDLEDATKGSFYEIQKPIWGADKPHFLKISQKIADKIADAHVKTNVPDGLLLVIEAKVDGLNTLITVKAEKSHAFSMTGNSLKLIKDIFLSSDKTLYKLGFFIKHDPQNASSKSYRYYVYDDAFAPANNDLAFYFYNRFLGLSTVKNSKLQTNKLHKFLTEFATEHIPFPDKSEVLRNIDRNFMNTETITLKALDFKKFFPEELESFPQLVTFKTKLFQSNL